MPNKVTGATDYLTVAGVAGSETYQCPNTAAYIAADTDYIWFKTDGSQRTTTTTELIGYDFPRTIVKYGNTAPNAIVAIMILKAGEVLTTAKENKMRDDFDLSYWWSNVLSLHGNWKSNRGTGQSYWPLDSCAQYISVFNAFAVKPVAADIVIQDTMLKALVDDGYFAKAELLDIFSAHNEAASLFNWKAPTGAFNPSKVNSPAFEQYGGFKGNSATGSTIRTNFIPATHRTIMGNRNVTWIIGIGDDVNENAWDFGAFNGGSAYTGLISRNANQASFRLQSSGTPAARANANSKKHYAVSHLVTGGTIDTYLNLVKATTTGVFYYGDDTNEIYVCGFNSNGTIAANNKTVRYILGFSYLTEVEVLAVIGIMEAYLDNYGKGLY